MQPQIEIRRSHRPHIMIHQLRFNRHRVRCRDVMHLQFTVQLIQGSEAEEKGAEPVPNDPVMKELRSLLKYKSYTLLDTSVVRATDNMNSEVRMGEKAEFAFQVLPKVIRDETERPTSQLS